MSGLMIKLRPFEAVMVNGAVIENGGRESRLRIRSRNVNILRMKDALKPEDVTTPVKRAYYLAQLAVSGELAESEAAAALDRALAGLTAGADAPDVSETLEAARDALGAKRFYVVMRLLGGLFRESGHAGNANNAA